MTRKWVDEGWCLPPERVVEELLARRDFLASDDTTWVKRSPERLNESCLVASVIPCDQNVVNERQPGTVYLLSDEARDALDRTATGHGCYHATYWNDRIAKDLPEVLDFIDETIRRLKDEL